MLLAVVIVCSADEKLLQRINTRRAIYSAQDFSLDDLYDHSSQLANQVYPANQRPIAPQGGPRPIFPPGSVPIGYNNYPQAGPTPPFAGPRQPIPPPPMQAPPKQIFVQPPPPQPAQPIAQPEQPIVVVDGNKPTQQNNGTQSFQINDDGSITFEEASKAQKTNETTPQVSFGSSMMKFGSTLFLMILCD